MRRKNILYYENYLTKEKKIMEKTNRELLEEVIKDRLTKSLDNAESNTEAFEEAMKAIAKQNDIDKHIHELEKHVCDVEKFNYEVEMNKLKHEHEVLMDKIRNGLDKEKLEHEKDKSTLESKKNKRDMVMKIVEIGAIVVAAPLIEAGCKKAFAEILCNFEKDYTFTTTAGRSLSSLFRFK
jgi:hypothetical protein